MQAEREGLSSEVRRLRAADESTKVQAQSVVQELEARFEMEKQIAAVLKD